jgi:hypothetical protein
VLLCQTKRYLSSANEVDIVMILDELYKMGCRDEFAVAGHWAAHADADDVVAKAAALGIATMPMVTKMCDHLADPKKNPKPNVLRREIVHAIAKQLCNPVSGDRRRRAIAKCLGVAECPTVAALTAAAKLRKPSAPAPSVHYVFAVMGDADAIDADAVRLLQRIGTDPADPTVAAKDKTGTVRLLRAAAASAGLDAPLISGYYPVRVAVAEPADVVMLPVPTPPPG